MNDLYIPPTGSIPLIDEALHGKRCLRCGDVKLYSSYSPHLQRPDRHQSWCKECRAAYARQCEARKLADLVNETLEVVAAALVAAPVANTFEVQSAMDTMGEGLRDLRAAMADTFTAPEPPVEEPPVVELEGVD